MVVLGDLRFDHLHIGFRVQTLDLAELGAGRLLALQPLEGLARERIVDGAQAVGTLGMANAGIVLEAGGMGQKQRGHAWGEFRFTDIGTLA